MVSYETQTKVMFITGLWDENSLKALDAVWSFFHPITNNKEKKITDVYKNSGRELHIVFLFLFFFLMHLWNTWKQTVPLFMPQNWNRLLKFYIWINKNEATCAHIHSGSCYITVNKDSSCCITQKIPKCSLFSRVHWIVNCHCKHPLGITLVNGYKSSNYSAR